MLEMLNEMFIQVSSNLGDDNKLDEMELLDDILRNINPMFLTNEETTVYNKIQNQMWDYFSGK